MKIETVGIVGYGAFGALAHTLIRRFAPDIRVRAYSLNKKPDGKTFFTFSDTVKCDAVIFAVPIRVFEEVLLKALPLMPKNTVIVDVATVKVHTVELLKRLAKRRPYIATHPVWGPESYEKRGGDVTGFRIIMTDGTLAIPDYMAFTGFLKKCGFDVVEMSAEAHDQHLAETLFLTHYVAQIIAREDFKRTDIDTVSFGFLMDAVESVKNDGALFRDVFRFNPYCKGVLERFKKAEFEVRTFLSSAETKGKSEPVKIGVSGAQGSFSEEAARIYARASGIKRPSLEYLISVENVLSALDNGAIDVGIFPIENSIGGVVTEAVHGMAKHNFNIKKMFDIDIHQNLLVKKGVVSGKVKTVVSHEQALKQCRAYLKREWPKAKIQEYEDTAKAAEDLAVGKLPASAAVIASAAAAKLYKLKVLEKSIQDLKENFTTFIAATR